MKKRHHTPDQVIRKLAEGDKSLNAGNDLAEVCRQLEIAESTWHRWKSQYGGMKVNDAKRLKELEIENGRLKRIVADLTLCVFRCFCSPSPEFLHTSLSEVEGRGATDAVELASS
jgi:putative transposase